MAFERIKAGFAGWALAWGLAMALAFVTADAAAAKPMRKSPQDANPAAPAAVAPMRPAVSGARFFTINEVLARGGYDRAGVAGRVASEASMAADAVPPGRNALGPEPFGLYAFRAPDGLLWQKWRGLSADLEKELAVLEQCRANAADCTPAAARFVAITAEAESRAGRARLDAANRLFNDAIRYVNDLEQHGAADRWSAPLASLAAGRGDCEDYAIAKYVALRAAGVPEADMRLVLVRDTSIRVDHAVLAVREEGRWLVLDNRRAAIVEATELRQYLPLFAVSADGVKLFAAPYAAWGENEGEGDPRIKSGDEGFAGWALRGAEFAGWSLRGVNAEPSTGF